MLTKEALVSALPLAQILDDSRRYVAPIVGTPLDELVKATRSIDDAAVVAEGDFAIDVDSIEYMANKKDDVLNVCQHDVVMDEITAIATETVRGLITVAKTVVAPVVQDLAEKVATSLRELTPSALLGMEVVVWNPPAPLTNPSFESAVRRFEAVPFDSPPMIMRLPSITFEQMKELLNTGSAGVDKDIAEWVAEKGESFFLTVWENLFQQKQADLSDTKALRFVDWIESRDDAVDIALAVYLFARRLVDEPLEDTQMDLQQFENTVAEFRNQAGARLVRAIEECDTQVKAGMLIRSQTDRVATVNGLVYRPWIEAGGENEVLFGNMMNLPAVYTVADINEKAEGLKAHWARHVALTATVESNRRFLRTKQLLERHFESQMFAIEGEEATESNRRMVMQLFQEELANVTESEMDNLYNLCLRLVCRSRFVRTDAERILSGIERIKRENPNIDVREAAAVSVVEYVAYWVSAQLKVEAF